MLATSNNILFPGYNYHANHRYWWPFTCCSSDNQSVRSSVQSSHGRSVLSVSQLASFMWLSVQTNGISNSLEPDSSAFLSPQPVTCKWFPIWYLILTSKHCACHLIDTIQPNDNFTRSDLRQNSDDVSIHMLFCVAGPYSFDNAHVMSTLQDSLTNLKPLWFDTYVQTTHYTCTVEPNDTSVIII